MKNPEGRRRTTRQRARIYVARTVKSSRKSPTAVTGSSIHSIARRSRANASSICPYEKFAFRPLGFGSTKTRAPSIRSVLQAERDRLSRPPAEDRPEQRHADEGDHFGFHAADLSAQGFRAGHVLLRAQRIDSRRRSRDQVGDADAPLRQPVVVGKPDRLRHQARFVEQLPEAVRRSGEMVADLRRADAGVDPDEQHANRQSYAIAKRR